MPQQYAYQIKKLGVFSHVNAYEKYGTVYIVATPNIVLFKNQNSNYFDIDIRAFQLDSYEISKIDSYLRTSGNILLSQRYQIGSPSLSYYIMNVFITQYSDAQDNSVDSQIYDVVSNYFLNFTRLDRVPKSDIIFEPSEIPIIRGGWSDRNSIYYSDNIEDSGLKSINIIRKGYIDPNNKQQI